MTSVNLFFRTESLWEKASTLYSRWISIQDPE